MYYLISKPFQTTTEVKESEEEMTAPQGSMLFKRIKHKTRKCMYLMETSHSEGKCQDSRRENIRDKEPGFTGNST